MDRYNLDTVKLLLNNNALPDETVSNKQVSDRNDNYPSYTALHIAVTNGHLEIVKALLNKKASVNKIIDYKKNRYWGFSPLDIAVFWGYSAICSELINHGADVAKPIKKIFVSTETETKNKNSDYNGYTPLHIAAECDNENQTQDYVKIVESLLAKDKTLIDKEIGINVEYWGGYTPLHLAIHNLKINMCKTLLKNHADVNKKIGAGNLCGFKAIHLAAAFGNKEIFELLVKERADINEKIEKAKDGTIREIEGFAPIHLAAFHGNSEIFKVLITNKANTSITVSEENNQYAGLTAFEIAKKLNEKGYEVFHGTMENRETILALESGKIQITPTTEKQSEKEKIEIRKKEEEKKKIDPLAESLSLLKAKLLHLAKALKGK